ncbi:MAG: hypothetical protein R3C03_19110 [Pirellulaceae bacterium]
MKQLIAAIVVVLFLIVSGNILFVLANNDPLWLDELHTSWVVSGTWAEVAPRAAIGNQTPVYFWILKAVVDCLGQSPFSLRLVSVIATLATVVVAAVWNAIATRTWIGTVLLLVAIGNAAPYLYYGSEARPYAMLIFCTCVQLFLLLSAPNGNERILSIRTLFLVVSTAMLIGIHATAIIFVVAEVFVLLFAHFLLGVYFSSLRQLISTTRFAGITAGLMMGLPFLIALKATMEQRMLWSDFSSVSGMVADFLEPVCLLVFAVLVWGSAIYVGKPTEQTQSSCERVAWLVTTFSIVGLLAMLVISLLGLAPVAAMRYALPCWVAMVIATAMHISFAWNRLRNRIWARVTIVLAVFVLQVIGRTLVSYSTIQRCIWTNEVPQIRTENWDSLVQAINERNSSSPTEILLLGNILEDSLLQTTSDNAKLNDYLEFPLRGIYSVGQSRVVPAATWSDSRLRFLEDFPYREQSVFVVARMGPSDLSKLESQLQRIARKRHLLVERIGKVGSSVQGFHLVQLPDVK